MTRDMRFRVAGTRGAVGCEALRGGADGYVYGDESGGGSGARCAVGAVGYSKAGAVRDCPDTGAGESGAWAGEDRRAGGSED